MMEEVGHDCDNTPRNTAGMIVCDTCGSTGADRRGFTSARGLAMHKGRAADCLPLKLWVCVCALAFVSWVLLNAHQHETKCVGLVRPSAHSGVNEEYVWDADDVCRTGVAERPPAQAAPAVHPGNSSTAPPRPTPETINRRGCVPVTEGVPIFKEAPGYVPGGIGTHYLDEQFQKRDAAAAQRNEAPSVMLRMDELEAHFLALAVKHNMSGTEAQDVINFCHKLSGPRSDRLLRSYRVMKDSADEKAGAASEYRTARFHVPDADYTATGLAYVDFECLDVLTELVAILSDPDLIRDASSFTTEYAEVFNEAGERVFTTDVNSGHWQKRTEGVLFGDQPADRDVMLRLGPLIIFTDGVALTKKGDQSAKPIMITLACLSPEVRQRKSAWRICGYLPKLEGQAAKSTTAFKEAQIELYLGCMSFFFEPICAAYDAGGIFVSVLGKVVCIVPVVAFFTVDSMEAGLMCGVRASISSKFPCRFCWCPGHQMNDPYCDVSTILRQAEHMRTVCTQIQALKETPRRKCEGEAMETQFSVRALYNPLWDLPYGANPRGLYGACPPELLHQYLLGMMKYAYKHTWHLIESYSPGGSDMSSRAVRVDQRFKWFNVRHVDPELPNIAFRKGAFKLKKLEGKDYRALVLQFIVVLGAEGNIIPAEAAAVVQRVLWKVCEVYDMLTAYEGHTSAVLALLDRRIRLMMREFKACFGQYSKSNCCFMKFHFCLHLIHVILEWASMRAVDSGFGEAKQKDVRRDFLVTSRRPTHLHTELSRVSLRARHVVAAAAGFGINLNARPVRRPVEDCLRGPWVDYDVATGISTPHRELPYRVRGQGFRTALNNFNDANDHCLGNDVNLADVNLFTSMRLTAAGSPGPTIFHASPSVYNKPWYDCVRIMCDDGDGQFFAPGLLQTFVLVHVPGRTHPLLLALVQLFGVRTQSNAANVTLRYNHNMDSRAAFQHGVEGVPFPVMERCVYKSGEPYLWLVDTECISKGLWAQQCFDNPSKFWFFVRGECTERVVAGGVVRRPGGRRGRGGGSR